MERYAVENCGTRKNIYLLTVTAKDKLENVGTAHLWLKVDTPYSSETQPTRTTDSQGSYIAPAPQEKGLFPPTTRRKPTPCRMSGRPCWADGKSLGVNPLAARSLLSPIAPDINSKPS